MIRMLEAMTRMTGFTLQKRSDFLLEAKRACKVLNSNRSQLQLDAASSEIADKFHEFEEKAVVCQIQQDVVNKLKHSRQCSEEEVLALEGRLSGVEELYLVCKQYNLYEEQLDLLSFCNDPDSEKFVKRLWELVLAAMVHRLGREEWMQNVVENLHKMVNKYNLQQQPWMFDLVHILKELHVMDYRISLRPSDTAVVEAIYPKIKSITSQQMVAAYKRLLSGNQIPDECWVYVMRSIRHLLENQAPNQGQDPLLRTQQASSIRDPRLSISHISHSIISSTSVEDLASQCLQYLERHNVRDRDLLEFFKNAS